MVATALSLEPHVESSNQPLTAVVLDDDLFDRARMRRFLERSGLQIETVEAETLEEFEHLLSSTSFDVLLIDFWLPQGNGFDAFDLHLQSARNRDTAAVLVSRRAEVSVAAEALQKGFKAVIGKDELSAARLRSIVLGLDDKTTPTPEATASAGPNLRPCD